MDFFDYHTEYLVYIDARGHSPCTVATYKSDANTFRKFLISQGLSPALSDIDHKVIRKYIVWMKNACSYGPNTMKRKLDSLSSFYNYLEAEEVISHNPMRKVDRIKKQKRPRTYLTEEEVKRLLFVADNWKVVNQERNQALIRTFLFTGLRISEICLIDWDDVDFEHRTIRINKAKGNKSRVFYMNGELGQYLWAYLETRLPLDNKALFLNRYNNRMHRKNANPIIRQYCKKAGIPKHVTAHILRHTFATLLIRKGVDIVTVKDLLDHEDLSTTQVYTHSSEELQRAALEELKF